MYVLYLQFTTGNEGYYQYEENGHVYYGSYRDAAEFPSAQAAIAKARRLKGAGYHIAYYEAVR